MLRCATHKAFIPFSLLHIQRYDTISILLICIVSYGMNLLIMDKLYGLHDLTRPLQSMASYNSSTLTINVAAFLILFVLYKWITLTAIAGMILCISLLCINRYLGIALSSLLIFIGVACTLLLNANGPLQCLYYCNFYTLILSEILLQQYMNLNILGYPISLSIVAGIFISTTTILFYSASCLIYLRKQSLQYQQLDLPWSRKKQRIHPSLFSQELYKLLWRRKQVVFSYCLSLFNVFNFTTSQSTLIKTNAL